MLFVVTWSKFLKHYIKHIVFYIMPYTYQGKEYAHATGSRAMVMHGTAHHTSGGLIKANLKRNKYGNIVSRNASLVAKKRHKQAMRDPVKRAVWNRNRDRVIQKAKAKNAQGKKTKKA